MKKFTPKACEQLGHYVYLYIDPRDGRVFYVGKGSGNRCFTHGIRPTNSRVGRIIREIRASKREPVIEILKHGLSESQALLVESTAIDLLDIKHLANDVRGFGSRHGARGTCQDVAALLDPKPAKIKEPAVLINITRAYRPQMDAQALYDATRSAWRVGNRRHEPAYAFSVYRGVVREVYRIAGWVEGGSTMRADNTQNRRALRGRWEFVGDIADEALRRKYVGRSVAAYFAVGAQNPIKYVNSRVARSTSR